MSIDTGAAPALDPVISVAGRDQSWFPEARSGNLSVRLAVTPADVAAVQGLRYRVFYDEMSAIPTAQMQAARLDFDSFDPICDHLIVTDYGLDPRGTVVGTYRVLRGSEARRHGRFYTADEFDIAKLLATPGEVLELGRSCVDHRFRNRPTMQLLWLGLAQYVYHFDIALMFGCASLPGVEPQRLATSLSYLHHYHLAPPALRPRAHDSRYVDMNYMPSDEIDSRAALVALPPLVKGYVRLGAFVGDGAVVDHQFNTTDVCVVVKTDLVTERYARHFERRTREAPGVAAASARLVAPSAGD